MRGGGAAGFAPAPPAHGPLPPHSVDDRPHDGVIEVVPDLVVRVPEHHRRAVMAPVTALACLVAGLARNGVGWRPRAVAARLGAKGRSGSERSPRR